jgi:hypothetical protein
MTRFLRLCSIILVIGFLGLWLLDLWFTWAVTRKPLSGIEENKNYDCLIAGDSRTTPLQAPYLDIYTGLKTINIGYPAYTIEDNHKILKYFFERGNRVERVYLQFDLRFGTAARSVRDWYYHPYILRHESWFKWHFPFKFYSLNNSNIKPSTVIKETWNALRGFDSVTPFDSLEVLNDFRAFKFNPKLLKDNSKDTLLMDKLLSLDSMLKRNGVKEMVIFTAPFAGIWFPSQSDTSSYKKKIREAGFRYHDFSTAYLDTTYFMDYTHIKNNRYFEFCRLFSDQLLLKDKR